MNKKLFWIFALSSSVYFMQGFEGLPSQSLFYYLKDTLNFSPQKIMVLTSLTMGAWLVKPVIGFVVDNFFSKRAWIFISLLADVALVLTVGFFNFPIAILVAILLLTSTSAAFRDVSVDGIMCQEGKLYQATGKIQSIQWISISVSGLLTGYFGGLIAEKWGYQKAFLCLLPFYLVIATAAYFFHENKDISKTRSTLFIDLKKLFSDKRIIVVGIFIFLYKFSPSFGTPLFFIQRDEFKWSKIFIGSIGTISTIFQVTGAIIYYKMGPRLNLKKWLYFSVFLGAVTTLSYLYYTPVSAIAYDIIYSLVGMFIFLLVMDFMARNSTPGLEATSFAFLCSMSNLALIASNLTGAFFLPILGLKWLIIISAATSFLCLPLIKKI